jgi:hypothetical protein
VKTAHLVTGGKGNIGKTAFAELLTCAAINAGHAPELIDADSKKQTFSRLRGNAVHKIALSDDPMFEAQPDLIWHLLANGDRDVIVDLAAQSDHLLTNWLQARGIARAAESNQIQIIKWWVADLDTDSFDELSQLHKNFPTIRHVLVQSHFRVRPEMWEETLATNAALKGAIADGLETIEFPRMFVGVMDRLRQRKLTLTAAVLDDKHEHMDMLDRSTVINWVEAASAQIQEAYQFTPSETDKPPDSPKPPNDSKEKTSKAK